MSAYHSDICSKVEIKEFREKVVKFLTSEGIKPHRIKALRSYDGEIRLYKSEQLHRLRLRMGRKFVAFKNPDGTYEGEDAEAIEELKRSGGDQLWESTNDPIPCANYTQVFRVDNWEEEKKAIKEFYKGEKMEGKMREDTKYRIIQEQEDWKLEEEEELLLRQNKMGNVEYPLGSEFGGPIRNL